MVSGHEIETKSERRNNSSSVTFSPPRSAISRRREIRVIGQHVHAEQALAQRGDAAADIAKTDNADRLAPHFRAHQRVAVDIGLAPKRAVGLNDPLRQRYQHGERMFGDRMRIAAGLIDHDHAGCRASIDIDGIVARAVAGDDQQVRRPAQQIGIDVEVPCQFVARGADLIGMRSGKNRRRDVFRTFILEPVEPDVGRALSGYRHKLGWRDI